jgi:hypothetical protein
MTALAEAPVFQAGIYDDLDESAYHADPVPGRSLSVSGAKKLLPPSCPARFAYDREHPPAPTSAMELGTAAHKLVLGTGAELAVVDALSWRTNDAKDQAKAARAEGKVPLLPVEHHQVKEMAAAIRAHRIASVVFDPERGGHPEQSLFWEDQRWGIWRRSRVDWLPDLDAAMPVLADYKTCQSADPGAIARSMGNFRYFMQDAWYVDGIEALTGLRLPFLFIFQEKEPPYLVTACQLDPDGQAAGREHNERALEIYRDCEESGIWPGYTSEVAQIRLPMWAQARGDYS